MHRPRHDITAAQSNRMTPERLAALGLSGALTIAALWAIASGLAGQIVRAIPHAMEVSVVTAPSKPQPTIAPPKPALAQPKDVATVPPPVIDIQSIAVVASPSPPASTNVTGITSTHTSPPYPVMAKRLGEQGSVTLHLTITPQGDVASAQIVKSSGFADLDSTAQSWVVAHWKYKPALQNGAAVPSTADAAIVFDLKNAG